MLDPGDALVVEAHLLEHGLDLRAILLTHHHADHVGGVAQLLSQRRIPVFGPAGADIPEVTHPVGEGDAVAIPELDARLRVLEVPGHTATHIAYYAEGLLFPGDTLFSAGCGRLLGGTAAQLHDSLRRLAELPDETSVYSAHEYTLANLAFAKAAEPPNPARDAWTERVEALRAAGQPSLPSRIAIEKQINPFLRTDQSSVIDAVTEHSGKRPADSRACFAALREWKDDFRA